MHPTLIFINELRCCCMASPLEPTDQAGDRRRLGGAQQTGVVACEAAVVLRQTNLHERRRSDLNFSHRLAAGQREVVVRRFVIPAVHSSCKADALPSQKHPYRGDPQLEPHPPPERQAAPVPSQPVREQQDMPRLFLNDRFERIDQFRREESRTLRDVEQPERKEAVDALGKTRDQIRPLGIAWFAVVWFRRKLDAVRGDKIRQHLLVPALLPAIALDGLPPGGIGKASAVGKHTQSRLALGLTAMSQIGRLVSRASASDDSIGQSMIDGL